MNQLIYRTTVCGSNEDKALGLLRDYNFADKGDIVLVRGYPRGTGHKAVEAGLSPSEFSVGKIELDGEGDWYVEMKASLITPNLPMELTLLTSFGQALKVS